LAHQPRVQDQEVHVWRAARRGAGTDGAEAVDAARVGGRASPAGKSRIVEAPGGVGLPDLEDHVVERLAVELGHHPGDLDRRGKISGQVARLLGEFPGKERPERHLGGGNQAAHGITAVPLRPRTTSWCSKIISFWWAE